MQGKQKMHYNQSASYPVIFSLIIMINAPVTITTTTAAAAAVATANDDDDDT